jgi:hypothetical protein
MWTGIKQFLRKNIIDALRGANSPSSSNVFVTANDLYPTYTELDPVLEVRVASGATQTLGNRYRSNATSGGWTINNIYEWDGGAWVETIPVADDIVDVIANGAYQRFTGSAWVAYGGTALLQGGNNTGANITVGSRSGSNQAVNIRVGNVNRVKFSQAQTNFNDDLYIGDLTTVATAKFHVQSASGNAFQIDGSVVNSIVEIKDNANTNFNAAEFNVTSSSDISIVGGTSMAMSFGPGTTRLLFDGVGIELSSDGATHAAIWMNMDTTYFSVNFGVDTYLSIQSLLVVVGNNSAEELRLNSGVNNGTFNIAITSLNNYVNDAAADADTNLVSGGLYHITGSRVVHRKP